MTFFSLLIALILAMIAIGGLIYLPHTEGNGENRPVLTGSCATEVVARNLANRRTHGIMRSLSVEAIPRFRGIWRRKKR
jgi:hypothetical protein